MTDAFRLAVRHSCWANEQLMMFCGSLSAEQLTWTAPGTYGTVLETLNHIVGAENSYLFALTGTATFPPLSRESPLAPLELLRAERAITERAEEFLARPFDATRVVTRPDRPNATAGVVLAQLVHHGSDHRAHVGTILGARGVETPQLDVWAYGRATGQVFRS